MNLHSCILISLLQQLSTRHSYHKPSDFLSLSHRLTFLPPFVFLRYYTPNALHPDVC